QPAFDRQRKRFLRITMQQIFFQPLFRLGSGATDSSVIFNDNNTADVVCWRLVLIMAGGIHTAFGRSLREVWEKPGETSILFRGQIERARERAKAWARCRPRRAVRLKTSPVVESPTLISVFTTLPQSEQDRRIVHIFKAQPGRACHLASLRSHRKRTRNRTQL